MPESLRESDRVLDRIRLSRQVDERPVFVVEGSIDRRFVDRVIGGAALFVGPGRDHVLNIASVAAAEGIDYVSCIVDRDFDNLVGRAEADGLPLIPYDDADLEAMLWNGKSLDHIVDEFASQPKLTKFGGVAAVRAVAAETLRPLARLRRLNALNGWGIPFDTVDLRSKINKDSLELRLSSLCDALWTDEVGVGRGEMEAIATSADDPVCPVSKRILIRGRDALAVLAVALRRTIGTRNHQQTNIDLLAESLRLAASPQSLASTAWFARAQKVARP